MSLPVSFESMDTRGKRIHVETRDRLSNLPEDVLLRILKKMSTKKAIQTSVLSWRWRNVWKDMSYLDLDMRKAITFKMESIAARSDYIVGLITKVINNHNGPLERCRIHHFSYQSKESTMIQTWIRTLVHVKNTKGLELLNLFGQRKRARVIHLPLYTLCHPFLTSLHLSRYDLEDAHAFKNCRNLTVLKFDRICAKVDVFNTIIASCPNLRVLVLDITWYSHIGCLKIHNNNLQLLDLACTYIERIEVIAPQLTIFAIRYTISARRRLVPGAISLLQIHTINWVIDKDVPYSIMYSISHNAQDKENMGHEYAVRRYTNYMAKFKILTICVDLVNPQEFILLKEVFTALNGEMKILQINLKNSHIPKEEGGSSKKKWEVEKLFTNANFRVQVVRIKNVSNKEEVELASRFVTRGIVMNMMKIQMSSTVPENKKLEINTELTKLMLLPRQRGNEDLRIECFCPHFPMD